MALRRREWLALAAVGIAAAGAGAIVGPLALQSGTGVSELLAARFSDLDGRPRRLLEWRGRALLCNFWATWCAPCREEIPLLASFYSSWAAKGADMVGIALDTAAKVQEFAANYKIPYRLLLAGSSTFDLLPRLGNRPAALPFTVALSAAGALTYRKLGALTAADLPGLSQALLG